MNSSLPFSELSEIELADALENCAKEPIHLMGSIQPHGVLLTLSDPEMKIIQVSNNAMKFFGVAASSLIHQPIERLLSARQTKRLKEIITSGVLQPIKSVSLDISYQNTQRRFDAIIHRSENCFVLEMEPEPLVGDKDDLQEFYDLLRAFAIKLRGSDTLEELHQRVVDEIRGLTLFDRVKLYKFDEDWNGTVVAESRAEYMPSYLGLRFPSTDIPEQARKLYSESYLRMITDIHYEPVPIIPLENSATGRMTDLGLSVLRSVSPVHLQYLDNMNVRASMSISIIQNRKLWGLIACHHNEPKFVPFRTRMAAELIGHIFSSQLSQLEDSRRVEQDQKKKITLAEITATLSPEEALVQSLEDGSNLLLEVLDADGFATFLDGQLHSFGAVPSEEAMTRIIEWLEANHPVDLFYTHCLEEHVVLPMEADAQISGLLTTPIMAGSGGRVFWFRNELVQQVNWAGKPEKNITMDSVGFRLTPRGSFSLWKETSEGLAPRWSELDVSAAARVRHLLEEKIEQDARVKREHELESAARRHDIHREAIFNVVGDGIVTFDAKGDVHSVNPATNQLLGYEKDELVGENLSLLMSQEAIAGVGKLLELYIETGDASVLRSALEVSLIQKNGHAIPTEVAIAEMGVDDDDLMFVGTFRDISDRKKAEETLQDSKEFLRLILSSNPDLVFVKDSGFRIVEANPAFLSVYPEHMRESVVGTTTLEAYDSEEAEEFLVHDRLAFETGSSETTERIAFPDGEVRTLLTKKVRFENAHGDAFILGIGRDVTEREILIKQLERSNEELDEFAYIASHDLKEPLRGIHNHSQFLMRDHSADLNEDGIRRLSRVVDLTQHMELLISDLLYFSRVGRSDVATRETDLDALVKDIVEVTPLVAEQEVEVRIPRPLPTITCDSIRVGEVFRNLIVNAIKYNDSEKKVIEIGHREQRLESKVQNVFFVKDNGIGIDPEFFEQVFRIFKRLHKKSDYGGGTGSGLTFVKKIIDRHGGRVWVESNKGEGTTFLFTLPSTRSVVNE